MTHIKTTHVGSLPRGEELTPLLLARDAGKPYDAAEFDRVVSAAVSEAVKQQVAAYKYPRTVRIIEALPKGATGKILKRELREA